MENVNINTAEQTSWHIPRLIIAWIFALLTAVAIGFLVPREQIFSAAALGIGFMAVVSFALQLGTGQREGFITRTSFSVVISALIIAITAIIFWV